MGGLRIATVRGIDVRLNWSVVIIGVLLTWSLADSIFPDAASGYSTTSYWAAGAITAASLIAALAAHELGHSLVALRKGVEVKRITLWLLGGIAELGSRPERPDDAMRIAAAGPLVSAALGVTGVAIGIALTGLTGAAVVWFGTVNLLIAGFNLLPAFPLDGGRIYQAYRWSKSDDEIEATKKAADLGLILGGVLVAIGVLEALTGLLVNGLWSIVIGLFIRDAGRSEWHAVEVGRQLEDLIVGEIMTRNPDSVRDTLTVDEFLDDVFVLGRHTTYPVVDRTGQTRGLVSVKDIRRVDRSHWATTAVAEIATPLAELEVMSSTDSASGLIDLVQRPDGLRVLVIDDAQLVGIVAPNDVARVLSYLSLVDT
jgi:Zn-dependent protease/CBS domain-containing protein